MTDPSAVYQYTCDRINGTLDRSDISNLHRELDDFTEEELVRGCAIHAALSQEDDEPDSIDDTDDTFGSQSIRRSRRSKKPPVTLTPEQQEERRIAAEKKEKTRTIKLGVSLLVGAIGWVYMNVM